MKPVGELHFRFCILGPFETCVMTSMASAAARSVVAVLCVFTRADAKVKDKFWGYLDEMAGEGKERSDVTTVAEILDRGAGVQNEDCGGKRDVMSISRAEFDWAHLQVRAYGDLSHNVSGGTLSVKMYKGTAAEGSS
ncbi:unnamed protein product [Prorocentrum cordatum]|uniref:Uncharacterized protein n=1 Tax=Prorocentrum cordatum TaxID=2364126 RepID=A0ABN9QDK0_9DINO|nr:unnamed protein product [Polarella glacialis]